MIGILEELECCARTELSRERLHELRIRERITRSLQEQHRNLHREEVRSALVRWPPGRMQRESEENQAEDSGQWRCCLRLRSHAAAKGFSAREKGKLRYQTRRFRQCCADGGLGKFRSVRPLRALLHIGKLIAKRGAAVLG